MKLRITWLSAPNAGKMYSSSKLIVSRNYFDGDADCYCPHCNAEDADIADLGSGEQPAVMAWNYQQARIDTLVEALEKAQQERDNWRTSFDNERFRADKLKAHIDDIEPVRAAAEKLVRCKGRYHSEQNYRALAALFGVNIPDLPPLEHENVHYADAAEMEIAALRQRIAELESRTVAVENLQESAYRAGLTAGWNLGLANNNDGFNKCLAAHAAGIKVEAE